MNKHKFTIITWMLTVISLIGVVLNIYKDKHCFYLWAVSNSLWCVIDYKKGIYAQAVLMAIYFCLSIWGILKW